MKPTFAVLLGAFLSVQAVVPAQAQSQLEQLVGVPAGLLTQQELATVFLKQHNDRANERRTVIYRDPADRRRLEPIFDRVLGPWSDIVVVWR